MAKDDQLKVQKKSGEINAGQINRTELKKNAGIFGAFMVDDTAHKKKKKSVKQKTRESLPENLTIEQMGEQLRTASYKVGDEKGERTKHSESMNKILLSIEAFDLFLDFPVVLDQEAFSAQIEAMEDRYRHLIADCLQYIETHNPWTVEGQVRKEKVRNIYDKAVEELSALKTNADSVHAEITADGEKTWRQIVRENRTQKYVNGRDGVRISKAGGNTSEISVIEKNGTKKFFKKKEALEAGTFAESFSEYVRKNNDIIARLADPQDEEFKDMSQTDKEKIRSTITTKLQVAADLKNFYENVIKKRSKMSPRGFLEGLLSGPEKLAEYEERFPELRSTLFYREYEASKAGREQRDNRVNEIDASVGALYQQGKYDEIEQLLKEKVRLKKDMSVSETCFGVVKDLDKPMFAAYVARRGPEIEKGRNLSSRNVATSRLAKFLGIGDCVVGCDMARVEIGGEQKEGIVMEEAKGTEMMTLMDEQEFRFGEYSVKAAKQCFALQVFDLICGQTDRHIGNYTAQMKVDEHNPGAFTIEGITGIDNDMAFGLMSYKRIKEEGIIGGLIGVEDKDGNFVLPALDLEVAHNILALEPGMLRYIVGDVLNAREMAAMTDRLQGVQSAIRKKMEDEKKAAEKAKKSGETPPRPVFMSSDEEWTDFLEEYGQKTREEIESTSYLQARFL